MGLTFPWKPWCLFFIIFLSAHFPIWHFGGAGVLQTERPRAQPCHRYSSLPPSLNPPPWSSYLYAKPSNLFYIRPPFQSAGVFPAWGMMRHLKAAAAAGLTRVRSFSYSGSSSDEQDEFTVSFWTRDGPAAHGESPHASGRDQTVRMSDWRAELHIFQAEKHTTYTVCL